MKVKGLLACICALIICSNSVLKVSAENGQVTYNGNAGKFIFAPGSDYTLTDLFPNFKDVMPGDSITQDITLKNNASNNVDVKIYMRSLGAQEGSEAFLSQLGLKVEKQDDTVMFEAAADETAQLTEWTYIGMLYSGGEVDLKVTLEVPTSLDNTYKNLVGYLDWEFMVEELSVELDDSETPAEPVVPGKPDTGDNANFNLWMVCLACAMAVLITFIKFPGKEAGQ